MELNKLLLLDQDKIYSLQRKIKQLRSSNQPVDKLEIKLDQLINSSIKHKEKLESAKLTISYPAELPITSRIEHIKEFVEHNQVVIISGSTGSGKTTQIPKILYDAGYGRIGRIGCTQPRRLAASGMAKRVSDETKTIFGKEVGCKVRFSDNTSDGTIIKFMTDGMLLSETISDRLLFQYDSIIIDEAHERSLNIDFILGYLKSILPSRPDLKIIISSATLNTKAFSEFFDNAPIIEIEGRMFPIEDFFLTPYEEEDLSSHVNRAVEWINDMDDNGDILIFLPGEKEIRDSADILSGRNFKQTEILPLYGRLTMSEQERVFQIGGRRRIILATNVAETSITIPGIHYVIDSGLVRINRYDPRFRIQSLQIEQISQASSKQRRGRCGRVRDGICIHLYDKETLESASEFTDPEICRSSLAEVILQMMTLNLPEIEDFPLIDAPKNSMIREGYKTLYDIGAIDKHNKLTDEGYLISSFPVDPHLAKIICHGNREKSLNEMIIIASFLSLQDPRERPLDRQTAADNAHKQHFDERSDFISILKLWNFLFSVFLSPLSSTRLRKLCKDNFLNYRRIKEWQNLYTELVEICGELRWKIDTNITSSEIYDYASIHRSIISAFPSNVGLKTEKNIYQGGGEIKFNLFPGSNIFKTLPRWVVSFSLVETTKLYARIAGEISSEWIETVVPYLCKFVYKDIHWQKKRGFVTAMETVVFRGLLIHEGRSIHYSRINPSEAREIFIRDALLPANIFTWGKWFSEYKQMLDEIQTMEAKIRRPESLLNNNAIYEHFEKVIPQDVCSVKTLEDYLNKSRVNVSMKARDAIYPSVEPIDWADYPDEMIFYKQRFTLKYSFNPGEIDDGVILLCPFELLNMIPSYACDWIIPGYLADKIKFLIKSLTKEKRILFNPVQQTADEFAKDVKDGKIARNQSLTKALSIFLSQRINHTLSPNDFDEEGMPNYLIMKIGEIREGEERIIITQGLPDREEFSSKIYYNNDEVNEWTSSNLITFPDKPLDKEVLLDENQETIGYPAIVDEGEESVGLQLFTDKLEAEANHKSGIIKLFRLKYPEQTKFLDKRLPLKPNISLVLSFIYSSDKYKREFADCIIYNTLTKNGSLEIRNKDSFEERAEEALGSLHTCANILSLSLEKIIYDRETVLAQIKKLRFCDENIEDINRQLEFLFKPGFLLLDYLWTRYPYYLKSLLLRIERMKNSPAKDLSKFAELKPYQKKFDDKFNSLQNSELAYRIMEFARLLQEFRIKVFAPEINVPEKVSAKILDQKWSEIEI